MELTKQALESLLSKIANSNEDSNTQEIASVQVIQKYKENNGFSFKLKSVSSEADTKENPDFQDLAGEYRTIELTVYDPKGRKLLTTLKKTIFASANNTKFADIWQVAEEFFQEQAKNKDVPIAEREIAGIRVFDYHTQELFKVWNRKLNGGKGGFSVYGNKSPVLINHHNNVVLCENEDLQGDVRRFIRQLNEQKAWAQTGSKVSQDQ